MSRALTIDLPDELAEKAEREGLLAPNQLAQLIDAEIRRRAWGRIREVRDKIEACGEPPMTEEEVQAVVDEVRAERRAEHRTAELTFSP